MKEKTKLFGTMRSIAIIALAAVIGFSMAACKHDSDGGDDEFTGVWTDSSDNTLYAKSGNWSASYSVGGGSRTNYAGTYSGSTFTISAKSGSGSQLGSVGGTFTVAVADGSLTVTPSGGGSYTFTKSEEVTTNPFIGTWKDSSAGLTVKCTAITWTASRPSVNYSESGKYAFSGNSSYFISDDNTGWGNATVSGNTMSVSSPVYGNYTLTK